MAEIEIISLPVERWPEFRALRLEALRDSPQAFGSSYASDAAYPDEHWMGRLREAAAGRSVALFAEDAGELAGMIGAFFEAGPEVANVIAVYVRPAYRERGVGKLLVNAVLDRLRQMPGTGKARLMVNVDQARALALYRRAGFVETGTERVLLGDGEFHDELIMECTLR